MELIARLPLDAAFGGSDFDIGSESDLVDAGFEPVESGDGEPAGGLFEVGFALSAPFGFFGV